MRPSEPTLYTDVTQEQFDRFRAQARARGLTIGGNKDNVTFDLIPIAVDYTPEAQTLRFTIHEPHWIPPGLTAGVLHTMVAEAMRPGVVQISSENPQAARDHTRTEKLSGQASHTHKPAHAA